ncbi:YlbF family regulator [Alkalihalobacterium sp. APHAB7]|uniref:YlbF family regulator n=1 Tax=Alkalihalobacterium sp. APHAB7 TaxID=3402081 RepID=UPI003AAFF13D
MSNIYDIAHELGKSIKESDEFKVLKQLHEEIEKDPAANQMLENFRRMQMELQQKQMQGMQITEEEAQKAQQLFELVQQQPIISKMMEAEQRLSMIITDINRIITEPLEELYGNPEQ